MTTQFGSISPPTSAWQIYTSFDQPRSRDHMLLSRALELYLGSTAGIVGVDIADAFTAQERGSLARRDRGEITVAINVLHDLLVNGVLAARCRPFGGGMPRALPADAWEIDDATPRFAWSALDPARPFDVQIPVTHWILVPVDQMELILERASSEPVPWIEAKRAASNVSTGNAEPPGPQIVVETPMATPVGRLLRQPEVLNRTGLSRSTLYERIEQRRFPSQIALGSRLSVWREDEVDAWIRAPR